MFDNLSEKLGGILDRLTGRGALSEKDVDAAMREVRRALLEADVALDVVRSFTDRVREQAIGATVVKSVTPGQMVVKIVHDELVNTLGADGETIDLNAVPPVAIMMVGLQGSGKTTTTAKLARRLVQRDKRKVLMASLDIYRPVGGDASKPAMAGMGAYIIAKHGMAGMLGVLAAEHSWLRVGTVSPGFTDTRMLRAFDERFLELQRGRAAFRQADDVAAEIATTIERFESETGDERSVAS